MSSTNIYLYTVIGEVLDSCLTEKIGQNMKQYKKVALGSGNLIIILNLGDESSSLTLKNGTELNVMTWLRGIIEGLVFGGYAVLFYPDHLTPDQLVLLDINRLEPDHGAHNNLVLPFSSAQDLLEQLTKIPRDFAAWPEPEDNEE